MAAEKPHALGATPVPCCSSGPRIHCKPGLRGAEPFQLQPGKPALVNQQDCSKKTSDLNPPILPLPGKRSLSPGHRDETAALLLPFPRHAVPALSGGWRCQVGFSFGSGQERLGISWSGGQDSALGPSTGPCRPESQHSSCWNFNCTLSAHRL